MAKLEIEVLGDVKSLETALAKAKSDLAKFKKQAEANASSVESANAAAGASFVGLGGRADKALKSLRSPAGAFAGGLAAGVVFEQINSAVNAASNLNEQVAKSSVVFGQASGAVLDWSKTTADAYGISRTAALEAAGTFGNITRSMGLNQMAAADLSRNMVNLAGDLASFNNVGTDDALIALRAAIVGEYEPLRRLGSALSEARVQQQAMVETGKRSAKELTNQEKVLARYHLILKDTALAQGDAARTADSFANQQRQLAAKAADLQANLGTLLLPVVTDLVTTLNDGASAALALAGALGKLGNIDLGPLGKSSEVLGKAFEVWKRTGPWALPNLARDAYNLLDGGGGTPGVAGNVPDPSGGLSGLLRPSGQPVATPPASIFTQARAPMLNLPVGFQNATLRAQNESDRGAYLKQLGKNREWYETQLQRAIDADDSKAVNELRQSLEGTQSAITGVWSQINAEAAKVRDAARDAREKAAAAARERGEKAQQALDDLGSAVSQAIGTAADAVKGISDAMQRQADDFKSEALKQLDHKQEGRNTMRELEDAREQMRRAEMNGGKFGIRDARRALEDAELGRRRFLLEGATVSGGAGGFNISGATFHFHGVQNVDQLLAQLQKLSKTSSGQTRGRLMTGGVYGIG